MKDFASSGIVIDEKCVETLVSAIGKDKVLQAIQILKSDTLTKVELMRVAIATGDFEAYSELLHPMRTGQLTIIGVSELLNEIEDKNNITNPAFEGRVIETMEKLREAVENIS